jgi:hypothetical protein
MSTFPHPIFPANRKEEKPYDDLDVVGGGSLLFSPDSDHVAYVAIENNKMFVVADGKEQKHYKAIAQSVALFSPDSKRLAYPAAQDNKWVIVVDGKELLTDVPGRQARPSTGLPPAPERESGSKE